MDWNLCYIYKKIHHMHASQEFCFTFFTKDKSSVTNAIQRTNTPTVDIYYLELVNGIFRNYSGWEDKTSLFAYGCDLWGWASFFLLFIGCHLIFSHVNVLTSCFFFLLYVLVPSSHYFVHYCKNVTSIFSWYAIRLWFLEVRIVFSSRGTTVNIRATFGRRSLTTLEA